MCRGCRRRTPHPACRTEQSGERAVPPQCDAAEALEVVYTARGRTATGHGACAWEVRLAVPLRPAPRAGAPPPHSPGPSLQTRPPAGPSPATSAPRAHPRLGRASICANQMKRGGPPATGFAEGGEPVFCALPSGCPCPTGLSHETPSTRRNCRCGKAAKTRAKPPLCAPRFLRV